MQLSVTTEQRRSSPRTRVGMTETAVWILHGLPPKKPINLFDHPRGDAVWYAEMLDAYLKESLEREDIPLHEHVRNGVYTMLDLLGEHAASTDHSGENLPAGMLACVRLNEELQQLEYFTIGDMVLLLDDGAEKHRVCAADSSMHKPQFDPQHQWALSFNADIVEVARHGQLAVDEVERVVGFTTAVDFAFTVRDAIRGSASEFLGAGNDVGLLADRADQYQAGASIPRDVDDIAIFEAIRSE